MNLPTPARFLVHQLLGAAGCMTWRWPFGAYLYLTFRCNLSCCYCDGGSGRKFPEMTADELTVPEWQPILAALRAHTDVLLLSGGEPTLYPDLRGLVRVARQLGFRFISLNTNGLALPDDLCDQVDALIISLDSLDRARSDRLWQRAGATGRVIATLERLAHRRHPSVMVNTVILPENLGEIPAIMRFCRERGLTFSAGPALDRTRAVPGLAGNPAFRRVCREMLAAKRAGWRIAATIEYLRALPDFAPFPCHPLLVWRVYPNGDLIYPCSRMNRTIGSLRGGTDPGTLFRAAAGGWRFVTGCTEHCPLSCYMDTSLIMRRPLGLLREGLLRLRSFAGGHRLLY